MNDQNPIRGLAGMVRDMDRMRHLGATGHDREYEPRERTPADAWIPAADIFCRAADLVIRVEVPGLTPDEIELTLQDGVLIVSGERGTEPDEQEVTFWQRERSYGAFRRLITLPENVTESQISAENHYGVLSVIVRGACSPSGTEPRRIRIGTRSP